MPSFNYPKTAIAGWLCESSSVGTNNSPPQGQQFYQQFTSGSLFLGLCVNAVISCPHSPENVNDGTDALTGDKGFDDIVSDMTVTAPCKKNH